MKLADFLNSLATKVEKQNEQAIIDILSNANLTNIDLADSVANEIIGKLLTIEGAKNNQIVKAHFTSQALNPFDTEMLSTLDRFELGDDFKTEFSANKNTYDKYHKLTDKIKESFDNLKAAKGNGNEKDIEKYTRQINDLNQKISQMKETYVPKEELEKEKKERENSLKDFMIHSKISGLKFANSNIPNDVNIDVAKILLDKKLSEAKAIIVKDGNELKLMRMDDSALEYYDSQNKPVKFDDFMNKTFADSKMLEVSGKQNPITPPAGNGNQFQFQPAGNQQPGVAEFQAAAAEAVNSLI